MGVLTFCLDAVVYVYGGIRVLCELLGVETRVERGGRVKGGRGKIIATKAGDRGDHRGLTARSVRRTSQALTH